MKFIYMPLLTALLLFISTIGFAQSSFLIDKDVAMFYPSNFDSIKNLPSFILLEEPTKMGDLPENWSVIPEFYKEDGKSCAKIVCENGTSLYGTGEVTGPLLRNGQTTELWNCDNPAYGLFDGKRLYQSHPWVMGVRKDGTSFGLIFDNTYRQTITTNQTITVKSDGPEFRVIVIEKTTPAEVLQELAELSGNMPLPPMWSLGYHQCRFSYEPDSRVKEVADGFRSRDLPCDVMWMDIDYMDKYKVFTFDPVKFPDPKGLNDYLHDKGFKAIYMIDPGVAYDSTYHDQNLKESFYFVYKQGADGKHFVTTKSGEEFHGNVWPGACAFPDFLSPDTREWWASLYKDFMATGIDGVWNDMNEPSVFGGPEGTMPVEMIHKAGGGVPEDTHARYHNVYGMHMIKGTREGIMDANPDKRPFVLSRSNFLGGHRYAATWTGDNMASWEHLKMSIPMSINLGLSGQLFSGPDVGGFCESATPELFAHWFALGTFYPFYRGHTIKGSVDHEPWSFCPEVENVARKSLHRRYRLLPYLYTANYVGSKTGMPIMQPAFFADLEDQSLRDEDEAFLFGSDLLIIPKWADNPSLPKGNWRSISICGEDSKNDQYLPDVRMKPGSIVPLSKIIQSTDEYSTDSITVLISTDLEGKALGQMYNDDLDDYQYLEDGYSITTFKANTKKDRLNISIEKTEGSYSIKNTVYRIGIVTDNSIVYNDWSDKTSYTFKNISEIMEGN
ncbi:TIM-barrel domain-containing protein [Plebeiibacterium sediminum]|uniref:DUF5110 domain-containing protein n=1 Tax=Plebeiibacterium sediminum TaxID=2992112 RepID=A0AAE3M384_9BACT|nr:TIM-barrel domain-containing protein [Plebeiobacterium sediminum]MCW3786274.1 DUF5110 domain-containing protein [Plebeiobacterium sediminum]